MPTPPRFGDPQPGAHYWRRPGAYAVIHRETDACLVAVQMHGRYWHLPGGGIDPGESPQAALAREVLEETGLRIEPGALIAEVEEYAWAAHLGHFLKAGRYHLATVTADLGPPQEADHERHWLPPEVLEERLVHPGQRWVVGEALRLLGRRRGRGPGGGGSGEAA